jgi:hypothetical protein
MGWLISHDLTKKEQVAELVKGWSNAEAGTGTRCLDYSVRGNTLFAVMEPIVGGTPQPDDRWIMVCLLRKDRGYGWGYRDLDESMGPFNYNCPMKFLRMVPKVTCEEWREGVRQWHANRAKVSSIPVSVGSVVKFKQGLKVLGESLDGQEGKVLAKQGRGYLVQLGYSSVKIYRRHIEEVLF